MSLGNTQDGSNVLVDTGSLAKTGDTTSFWWQIDHAVPLRPGVAVSRSYTVADCSNRTYQIIWLVTAGPQGQILQNGKTTDNLISNAVPGSLAGSVLQYACNSQPHPALQAQSDQALIVQAQLEALTRNRQTNAEAINEAMRIGASMFK